jgi:hypothetical protein
MLHHSSRIFYRPPADAADHFFVDKIRFGKKDQRRGKRGERGEDEDEEEEDEREDEDEDEDED